MALILSTITGFLLSKCRFGNFLEIFAPIAFWAQQTDEADVVTGYDALRCTLGACQVQKLKLGYLLSCPNPWISGNSMFQNPEKNLGSGVCTRLVFRRKSMENQLPTSSLGCQPWVSHDSIFLCHSMSTFVKNIGYSPDKIKLYISIYVHYINIYSILLI